MKLRRLLDMPAAELATRTRQEAHKLLERSGFDAGRRAPMGASVLAGRFFRGAAEPGRTARLAAGLAEQEMRAVLAAAERVARGRFDLLGYRDLRFGDPIDWSLDAVSGRRSPDVHWSLVDPLDAEVVGDHKVVWELNRQQWLLYLAQGYALSREEAYARLALARIDEWIAKNPRGRGIAWASSLEASLRLISWAWVLHLLRGARALDGGTMTRVTGAMAEHAVHVERYLSTYFSPNTHLTGEALGLLYAGILLPPGAATRRWRELGAAILTEECVRQVHADGVHAEQATCYQRYTLDIYLHFAILARDNGIALAPVVSDTLHRMLDFFIAVQQPDGRLPLIGDVDGGSLLPLVPRAADDGRAVLSTAAVLLGRGDCAWAAAALAPETLWLLGSRARQAWRRLRPAPPPQPASRLFASGGWAVMRSDWTSRAHQLLFDVGPLGCDTSAGHGHADLLSIQCAAFGRGCIVDPGVFGYRADGPWRDAFRSTRFHSTISVDGEEQAESAGPFAWRDKPRARLRRYWVRRGVEHADAEHEAYRRLADPVLHRRRVYFVGRRWWIVVDDLAGAAEHDIDVRWQIAPVAARLEVDGWARVDAGPGELLIGALCTVPLTARLRRGSAAPLVGWYAPDYGQRVAAPQLTYSATACLPLRIVTLLVPRRGHDNSPPEVTPLTERSGEISGVRLSGQRAVRFDGMT